MIDDMEGVLYCTGDIALQERENEGIGARKHKTWHGRKSWIGKDVRLCVCLSGVVWSRRWGPDSDTDTDSPRLALRKDGIGAPFALLISPRRAASTWTP